DVALLVQSDELVHDGARVLVVEREALLLVVAGGAKPLELLDDRAAVLLAPAPDAPLESLAAELLATRPLLHQRSLDLGLGRDSGVVGAEDPLRAPALHPVMANQAILQRVVERMAHVQDPGHVRR